MTAKTVKHMPGDVNHKFLGAAGHDFCPTCGSSLRGKRTALEVQLLEALEVVLNNATMPPDVWGGVLNAIRSAKGGEL